MGIVYYNSNTVVKQDFAVGKQVDGRAAYMTDTTGHQSGQSTPPPPYQIMLDPSLPYSVLHWSKLYHVWVNIRILSIYTR
jgi:hypothetical protein